MTYQYKIIGAPERGLKKRGARSGSERIAAAMQEIIAEYALDGWEYMRTDMVPCVESGGLFSRSREVQRAVMVFRRDMRAQAQQLRRRGAGADTFPAAPFPAAGPAPGIGTGIGTGIAAAPAPGAAAGGAAGQPGLGQPAMGQTGLFASPEPAPGRTGGRDFAGTMVQPAPAVGREPAMRAEEPQGLRPASPPGGFEATAYQAPAYDPGNYEVPAPGAAPGPATGSAPGREPDRFAAAPGAPAQPGGFAHPPEPEPRETGGREPLFEPRRTLRGRSDEEAAGSPAADEPPMALPPDRGFLTRRPGQGQAQGAGPAPGPAQGMGHGDAPPPPAPSAPLPGQPEERDLSDIREALRKLDR